jgi:hypothetical protein
MSKKLLILSEVFHPENFVINDLAMHWAEEGCECEVLTRVPSYPAGMPLKGYRNRIYQKTHSFGLPVHRVGIVSGYQRNLVRKMLNYMNFCFLTTMMLLFRGNRYDRIFVYQTGPLTVALAAVISRMLYRQKVIIWSQDLWPDTVFAYGFRKTRLRMVMLNVFVKWIYKRCDIIMVSSEGFIDKIRKMVPGSEVIYVPNWPDINCKRVGIKSLPEGFNFTFAGNVGKVQNLRNVLAGFALFAEKNHPNAWLNIIGDGSNLKALKSLVEEKKIPNVNFTGFRPPNEMPSYFAASDVLVISLNDAPLFELIVPLKFHSYLTASRPIYAIVNGEVTRLVKRYSLGVSADPSDIESISGGFERLYYASQTELKNYSANAAGMTRNGYSKEKNIAMITSILWPSEIGLKQADLHRAM